MSVTFQRFLFYTFGIIIMTFGIALTIQSQMGTSPFDALLVGLYKTFGLTIGSWEIVVGLAMVIFNALAMRRNIEYLALLTSFITGLFIDFWVFILSNFVTPETFINQMICVIVGIIIGSLGIAINLESNFAPNPMDRCMLVVKELTGLNVATSRAIISIILVILAFLFTGPIGIGTILSALFSGTIIHYFMMIISRLNKKALSRTEFV